MGTSAIQNRATFNKGSKNIFTVSNILWAFLAIMGCLIIAGFCLTGSVKEEEKKAAVYEDFKKIRGGGTIKQLDELKGVVISQIHEKNNYVPPCGFIGTDMLNTLSYLGATATEGNVKSEWIFTVTPLFDKNHWPADKQFNMVVKHHGKIVRKLVIGSKNIDDGAFDSIYVVVNGQPVDMSPQIIRDFFSDK